MNTFLDNMYQQNFQPCITEPTRIINPNKPSLVDDTYISLSTLWMIPPMVYLRHISYDKAYSIVLEPSPYNKKKRIKKRDKRNFDIYLVDEFIANPHDNGNLLLSLINAEDSESFCAYFLQKYVENLFIHQPMRNLSKKEKKEKPWLTQDLLKSIRTERKLFKQLTNLTTKK